MRILRIQQNINRSPFFLGNNKQRVQDKNQIRYASNPYRFNSIKTENYNGLGPYFDIKKLKSVETKENKIKDDKPLSFEDSHANFQMDRYQKEAVEAYNSGNTTIVTAPTGTGKTLIAEHCIKKALEDGKKIIYLSPLKALSNEKYTDFSKLFGTYDENGNLVDTKNVGLLTGDTQINPDAPLMVMTTEIYRNSLLTTNNEGASEKYKDYDGVIYDEFHYLGDKSRGNVWEEAVMYTPPHMKQLMLSATASNAESIKEWAHEINPKIDSSLVNVPEDERYVPLREFVLVRGEDNKLDLIEPKTHKLDLYRIENKINLSERQSEALEELKEIIGAKNDEEVVAFLKNIRSKNKSAKREHFSEALQKDYGVDEEKADSLSYILSNKNSTVYKKYIDGLAEDERLSDVVRMLDEKEMTPALIYIFSKKGCNRELEQVALHSESLLTPEESKQVYDEVQKCKEKGIFLGSDFSDAELEALMKGFAVHHAGKLPAYKSLVETLARKGLVKACFATETLLAGINMPFKSTVFTSLEKYDGEDIDTISTQIFKQGAGRAGRRGKDEIGNVVVMADNYDEYETYVQLSNSRDTSIKSQYSPSYASCLSDRLLNDKDDAILRSFASHESGIKLERAENLINSRLEMLKQYGYLEKEDDGTLKRTEKGELAKKIYGMNEIVLGELLSNPHYFEGAESEDLIAFAASFSDVKDEDPSRDFRGELKYLKEPMNRIFDLVDSVDDFEMYYGIKDERTPISTNLVPYIVEFSRSKKDRASSLEVWSDVMNKMREKELLVHEGDFLRVVNGTIDILKLIAELSPDKSLSNEAKKAIESLRKPPVNDIFSYELNIEN